MSLAEQIQHQDNLIASLTTQSQKLKTHIEQFRDAIRKKAQQPPPQHAVDDTKLQQRLEKELENARSAFKNYQHQLKMLQKKSQHTKYNLEEITALQEKLRQKEHQLQTEQEGLKDLQAVRRKQEKLLNKYQGDDPSQRVSKLLEEIRIHKVTLAELHQKNRERVQQLQKKQKLAAQLEIKDKEVSGTHFLSYQDFKARRREESLSHSSQISERAQSKPKKPAPTVKQIIQSNHLTADGIECSEEGLTQLKAKKKIAETSLEVAKKKYEKEILSLSQKHNLLRSQNAALQLKLNEKQKEKDLINQDANRGQKANLRTHSKLEPIN